MWLDKLKDMKAASRLTTQEIAKQSGIPEPTLEKLFAGATKDPKLGTITNLVHFLGYTLDDLDDIPENEKSPGLSTEAMQVARDYDVLDIWGRKAVRSVTDSELARVLDKDAAPVVELKPATKIIPLIGARMAAGPGEPDFGNALEEYEVPADTLADFAVHIHGDSMEPDLPDGSIQLCTKGTPRDGDVAVLLVDGAFYVKQICLDAVGNLYLFSLNRARGDKTIWASSGSTVSCFGTVIMNKRHPLPTQINDGR